MNEKLTQAVRTLLKDQGWAQVGVLTVDVKTTEDLQQEIDESNEVRISTTETICITATRTI